MHSSKKDSSAQVDIRLKELQTSEPQESESGPPGFQFVRNSGSAASGSETQKGPKISPFWRSSGIPGSEASSSSKPASSQLKDLQGGKAVSTSRGDDIPESFSSSSAPSSGVEKVKSYSDHSKDEASSRGSADFPNGLHKSAELSSRLKSGEPLVGRSPTSRDKLKVKENYARVKEESNPRASSFPLSPLSKVHSGKGEPKNGKLKELSLTKRNLEKDEVVPCELDTSELKMPYLPELSYEMPGSPVTPAGSSQDGSEPSETVKPKRRKLVKGGSKQGSRLNTDFQLLRCSDTEEDSKKADHELKPGKLKRGDGKKVDLVGEGWKARKNFFYQG